MAFGALQKKGQMYYVCCFGVRLYLCVVMFLLGTMVCAPHEKTVELLSEHAPHEMCIARYCFFYRLITESIILSSAPIFAVYLLFVHCLCTTCALL